MRDPLRMFPALGVALVLLGVLWRTVRYAAGFPLWGDEASLAMNIIDRDILGLTGPLDYMQVAPLGFLWAVSAMTRALGTSEWALRLVPFLAGVASVALFASLARRLFDRAAAFAAIAIFAVSYYPVRHGVEVKPYATDLLVALLLLALAWEVSRRPRSASRWIGLVVIATAGAWLSFPSVFVAGGVAIYLAYRLSRSPTPRLLCWLLVYGIAVFGSFTAMLVTFAGPHCDQNPGLLSWWAEAFPPITEPWRLPGWLLATHAGGMLAYPVGGEDGGSSLTLILVVLGAIVMWRRRKDLLLLLLGPLPLVFAAAAMYKYPYGGSVRVSIFMAPAFCLLAGLGLESLLRRALPERRLPAALVATGLLMGLLAVGGIVADVRNPFKTASDAENRRAIDWLRESTGDDDRWIVFSREDGAKHAPDISTWSGTALRFFYYVDRFAPVEVQAAPRPQEIDSRGAGRTWLLVYRDDKRAFPQRLLASYLERLERRLGAPHTHHFGLGGAEGIDVYEFPPPERVTASDDDEERASP
jgi:hypothetical protein